MNTRERLQEQYEEALFALLMDEVAEREGQELLEELERLNSDPSAEPPAELDRSCRKIIKTACKKKNMKKKGVATKRILQRIAVAALVAAILMAVAYAAIPEVRVGVLNLLLTVTEEYTGLGLQGRGAKEPANEGFASDLGIVYHYRLPSVPDEYELILRDEEDKRRAYFYENAAKEMIIFNIALGTTGTNYAVDTEDAHVIKDIIINGYDGIYIEKNNSVQIAWVDTDRAVFLDIWAEGLNGETIEEMAGHLRYDDK